MSYFEVSIPGMHDSNNCYSLAITDFELYAIPKPPQNFRQGKENNVLLAFNDIEECQQYESLTNSTSLTVTDSCIKDKYQIINERLKNGIIKQRLASQIHGHTFKVVGSQVIWEFSSGTTLSISGPMKNKVRYAINERRNELFLDLEPKLITENLLIQIRIDNQVELISEFSGKLEFILTPSVDY